MRNTPKYRALDVPEYVIDDCIVGSDMALLAAKSKTHLPEPVPIERWVN